MFFNISILTLCDPRGGGGGGLGGSARADFNLREFPCYLRYANEILPLLLEFIEKQDVV